MLFSKLRQPLSFRKYLTILGAIAAVLIILGLGGFGWLSAQSPLFLLRGSSNTEPIAAVFVPRQSPLTVSLLTSPERLVELRRVLTPPGRRGNSQAEVAQFKRSLSEQTGIDYDTDIRPWIGNEITFAVTDTDFDRDPTNGYQPGYVAAIAARNGERAREFLELFWQRQALAGAKLTFEVSSGVRIIYAEATPNISQQAVSTKNTSDLAQALTALRQQGQWATAVVGNRFVLLANHPQVLQQSIRNAQANQLNLTAKADYQSALAQLTAKRIGVIYCNLPPFFSWLGVSSKPHPTLTTLNSLPAQPQTQSLTAAVQLNRRGLGLATALAPISQTAFKPVEPGLSQPVEALRYLPADTALAAGGHNLSQLWDTLEAELDAYATLPPQIYQLRQWLLSVSSEQPLKNWLKADYAVGQWASRADQSPGEAADWVLVVEHSSAADTALSTLDQLAERQQLTVSSLMLKNQAVTAWSQIQTSIQDRFRERETTVETRILGLHTTVDGYDILATSLPAMSAALEAPLRSLIDTNRFKQAIVPFQQPNEGYLYFNWPLFRKTLAASVPWFKLVDTTAQPLLDAIQSITLSSYGGQTQQKQGEVLIQLANANT
ncbi:MAG: DUF3352 domain-containing protein [Cyanobacteria bacterium P01_A01_bin.114]